MPLVALTAAFFAKEVGVGNGRVAMAMEGRLGTRPGRPFLWVVDFAPLARSTLRESNALQSTTWNANATHAEEVLAAPGLTLRAVFALDASEPYSTVAFEELAANPRGAFVCPDRVGYGNIPEACVASAKPHALTCDQAGCWAPGAVGEDSTVWLRMHPGREAPRCTLHARLGGPFGPRLCAEPSEAARGDGIQALDVGLGSANPKLSLWVGPAGRGSAYVKKGADDPVELAGLAALLTVAFVLWCEQTAHVTALAAQAAAGAAVGKQPGAPPPLSHSAVTFARRLLSRGNEPLFFGDMVSTAAFALTLMAARHGVAPLGEDVAALLPSAYVATLSYIGVCAAWVATALAVVVLGFGPRARGPKWLDKDPKGAAAWLLAARCALETACLIGVHQLLPVPELAELPRVIGLFFGLVIVAVVTRDLLLTRWLGRRAEAAVLAVLWALTAQYGCFAMVLPAVGNSAAVGRRQAIVFAATLTLQAAGAGAIGAHSAKAAAADRRL